MNKSQMYRVVVHFPRGYTCKQHFANATAVEAYVNDLRQRGWLYTNPKTKVLEIIPWGQITRVKVYPPRRP
jgi:hypothetical protein